MEEIFMQGKKFPPTKAFLSGITGGFIGVILAAIFMLISRRSGGMAQGFFLPFIGAATAAGVAAWKRGSSGIRTFAIAFSGWIIIGVVIIMPVTYILIGLPKGITGMSVLREILVYVLLSVLSVIPGSIFGTAFGKPSFWRQIEGDVNGNDKKRI